MRKVLLCMLASSCEPPPAYNDFHAIELLARQGDAKTQHKLGQMYDIGENVEKNNSESVKWYFRSAEQGVAEAQHRLGLLYEYGQGVPKATQDYIAKLIEAIEAAKTVQS